MAVRTPSADEVAAPPPRSLSRPPPLVLLAIGFLVLVVAICLFADLLAPYDYKLQALRSRLRPPVFLGGTTQYLLGTDELGRDLLSRLIYAIRFSMVVALGGTLIGAVVGTVAVRTHDGVPCGAFFSKKLSPCTPWGHRIRVTARSRRCGSSTPETLA